MSVVACTRCGTKSRVGANPRGTPRCARCKAPLPWIVEAGDDDFDAQVEAPVPVLVDLWAPWCPPCRMVAPVVEQLASERAGRLKVVKLNADEAPRTAARLQARGIPTLVLFVAGGERGRIVGAQPAQTLRNWLDEQLT